MRCLKTCSSRVIIHDAVRPCLNANNLNRLLLSAEKRKAVTLGVPLKDTIKIIDKNLQVVKTLPRDCIWSIQTPQIFDRDLLYRAHLKSKKDNHYGTDDASLVEHLGRKVHVVEGDYMNIKITTPEDLILAKAWLRGKGLLNDSNRSRI